MSSLDTYLALAERPNTQKSYAASIKHFEQAMRTTWNLSTTIRAWGSTALTAAR